MWNNEYHIWNAIRFRVFKVGNQNGRTDTVSPRSRGPVLGF